MPTCFADDASTPPGLPVRLDVALASTSEAGAESPTFTVTPAAVARGTSQQETETPDTTQYNSTQYDSTWASTEIPAKEPQGVEQFIVGGGKMYVVLAVVLIIWMGLLAFLFSTDRRIRSLERDAD